MSGWTALLLAGARPGIDAFAAAHDTDLKALIAVCGTPMVARPAAALLAAPEITSVRVLAQHPERIAQVLPSDPRLSVEESGGTIATTLEAVLIDPATRFPLLVTTADHALLDLAMIADFCLRAGGTDLAIGVVERRPLMKRLPQTKRTWIRFRDGAYSGANLFAFGSAKALKAVELWRSVEQDRKKGWRVVAALGPMVLLGTLSRVLSLDQALAAVGRRLGLDVRKVEMSNPLAAVDVDKPSDHELVTAILEGRA